MDELESWRAKASAHASTDRIGHVIARYFDLIGAVSRDGVDAESVGDLVGMLAQDRAFAVSRDRNETNPLRELVYAMAASFGTLIDNLAKSSQHEDNMKMEGTADGSNAADPEYLLPKEEPLGLDMSPGVGLLPSLHEDQMERARRERERAGTGDDEPRSSMNQPSRKRPRLQPVQQLQHEGDDEDDVVALEQKCETCGRMFDSVVSLMNHLATAHRETPKRDSEPSKAIVMSASDQRVPPMHLPPHLPPHTATVPMPLPAGLPMIPLVQQPRAAPTVLLTPRQEPGRSTAQPPSSMRSLSHTGEIDGRLPGLTGTPETHKHPCELCPAKFKYPSGLRDHMRKHTGERPYQCPVCPEAFVNASLLKSHQRDDHGMLPFLCPGCDEKFALCSQLTQHKKTAMHGYS
ncbi:hypothetical protein PRIPAC_70163 [Pristionchus pacificus]|uniref:Zinc finger protein n=1 Tax=Pristionchus pacificus TaxID=54126 RepID=A0A454XNP8_PRIPA|nr:hypothetical protein PRIPAC_70163 [Pristionchus pacificus]|eukprot:PDM64653.1 zinc finger protein [Pristionchus pacificus]